MSGGGSTSGAAVPALPHTLLPLLTCADTPLPQLEQHVREALALLDEDRDGVLTPHDLRCAFILLLGYAPSNVGPIASSHSAFLPAAALPELRCSPLSAAAGGASVADAAGAGGGRRRSAARLGRPSSQPPPHPAGPPISSPALRHRRCLCLRPSPLPSLAISAVPPCHCRTPLRISGNCSPPSTREVCGRRLRSAGGPRRLRSHRLSSPVQSAASWSQTTSSPAVNTSPVSSPSGAPFPPALPVPPPLHLPALR